MGFAEALVRITATIVTGAICIKALDVLQKTCPFNK